MGIDAKTKQALIRKGNELFNEKKMLEAYKCYNTVSYEAGIEKIGDYYYYDRGEPLVATKFYLAVKNERTTAKLNEIFERMIFALKKLLREDDNKETKEPKQKKERKPDEAFEKKLGKAHFFMRTGKR